MITASDLVIRRGPRVVLDGVDLSADQGVTIGVVGPNGAGKSTLLSALYRNVAIASGRVTVSDHDLSAMNRREIAREVAVVSQIPDQALPLTVRDTVSLGRLPHRSLMGYGDATDRDIVDNAMTRTDLTGLADRLVTQLSGGERQRVLVARAIAQQAGHLLLDEPTNHLDIGHQFALLDLVKTIVATTVIVLHDLNLAARACDRLVLLDQGRLVASGPCEDLQPDHPLRVLDVCCGPGSLSNAVTQRFGDASCVGIDRDPVLMRLFRKTTPHPDRIEIVDVDLREPGWAARWAEEPFDAAVSATALHWFEPDELTRVHQDIASVLTPGGILLNADHLFFDKATEPFLAELAPAERDRTEAQMREDGAMSWQEWWDAALAMPGWESEAEEFRRRWADKDISRKVSAEFHLASMRAAGFTETAQVWQWFDDRILIGRMPM